MEIVNHRCKMLDAMERNAEGNDNFAIKVISTRKHGRSKKKKSNLFFPFSKLLPWATSLKLPSLE